MTETKTTMKSDSEIQQAVLRELAWDTRVKPTEVGVQVDNGVVTLTGTVNSYGRRVAAAEAAHRVRGVLDVANDIVVNAGTGARCSDTEIAQAVRDALERNLFVHDERIASTVSDGVVSLDGDMSTVFERDEAVRVVGDLPGVRAVRNHVEIKPSHVNPDDILAAVEEALARRAEREAKPIGVMVVDGQVVLSGAVHSWLGKRAIIGATSQAPGARSVDDDLRTEPNP